MKLLLDENLPRKLKIDFGNTFEVKTVREMGWHGKKNGELLGLIVFNGFDFFITIDKNLRHQQNLQKFDVTVFLLMAPDNRRQTLQKFVEKTKEIINLGSYTKLTEVVL